MNTTYKSCECLRYNINTENGDRLLIIPIENGFPNMTRVLCLVDTSLEMWNMILLHYTPTEIAKTLAKRYKQDINTIEKDVVSFLNKLLETGFIVTEGDERYG